MLTEYLQNRQAIKLGIKARPEKPAPKPIAKQSAKKKAELKAEKPQRDEQLAWYQQKVEHMDGICMECGEPINKDIFTFAIMTVAHVLPKRENQFPSVATHEENSLELCVTNGCHDRYDRSWEDAAQMKIWPLAVEKVVKMFPRISVSERMHLPDVLRQEILY